MTMHDCEDSLYIESTLITESCHRMMRLHNSHNSLLNVGEIGDNFNIHNGKSLIIILLQIIIGEEHAITIYVNFSWSELHSARTTISRFSAYLLWYLFTI